MINLTPSHTSQTSFLSVPSHIQQDFASPVFDIESINIKYYHPLNKKYIYGKVVKGLKMRDANPTKCAIALSVTSQM